MEPPFSIEDQQSSQFDLSSGFLPTRDPIDRLPPAFAPWEELALGLPKIIPTGKLRDHVNALPAFDVAKLCTQEHFERAMLLLSYLGHAYVWGDSPPVTRIPQVLAEPWCGVADSVGRPPVLSYASYALYNWRRIDTAKPIELGNIALLQNFLGGIDEEWFILIHVDIEQKATRGLKTLLPALQSIAQSNHKSLQAQLQDIKQSLDAMCNTLDRMPQHCDPYIYFNRVRPYIHGWKDNPALPNGLVYQGVKKFGEKPQFFKGETGAQSTIIPAFDAFFEIVHADNVLKKHLDEMQLYMPPAHQNFLVTLQQGSGLREYIQHHPSNESVLKTLYNECVLLISRFRKTHFNFAASYIQKQSQTSNTNPTEVGTGGTPFMKYLLSHLDETEKYLL